MVLMEMLEMVGRRLMRGASPRGAILPAPNTFEEFAAILDKRGIRVIAAPELDGEVVNQGGGQPFSMVDLNGRTQSGVGLTVDYGLLWANPVGVQMAPEVRVSLPEGHVVPLLFPQQHELAMDWTRPGELIVRWFPLADLAGRQPAAVGVGRRPKSRRRKA